MGDSVQINIQFLHFCFSTFFCFLFSKKKRTKKRYIWTILYTIVMTETWFTLWFYTARFVLAFSRKWRCESVCFTIGCVVSSQERLMWPRACEDRLCKTHHGPSRDSNKNIWENVQFTCAIRTMISGQQCYLHRNRYTASIHNWNLWYVCTVHRYRPL